MIRAVPVLAALAAAPAAAQQWEPGQACEPFLTVQTAGCMVTNYWTCDGAPDGYIYSASHDADGRHIAGATDAGGNWVDTVFDGGWQERLLHPVADPISHSNLVDSGVDAFDFTLLTNSSDPEIAVGLTRVRGIDILTGERVTIDGEDLLETTYLTTYAGPDGVVWATSRGTQYYSAGFRMVFSGNGAWIEKGDTDVRNLSPVDFLEPGDPGFGSITPAHGCDAAAPPKESDGAKSRN